MAAEYVPALGTGVNCRKCHTQINSVIKWVSGNADAPKQSKRLCRCRNAYRSVLAAYAKTADCNYFFRHGTMKGLLNSSMSGR